MKTLNISSVPLMGLIQKACETLVVVNTVEVEHVYNVADRRAMLDETQQAMEMVDHIRSLIRENHDG